MTEIKESGNWAGYYPSEAMRNRDMPAYGKETLPTAIVDGHGNTIAHGKVENPDPAGLTKREAAAIAAMQGILAADKEFPIGTNDKNANVFVARNAASYADALFDALEKKETQL